MYKELSSMLINKFKNTSLILNLISFVPLKEMHFFTSSKLIIVDHLLTNLLTHLLTYLFFCAELI